MTPAQQTALEALYGTPFTAQQVTDLDPLVLARNDAATAAYLSTDRTVQGSVPIGAFLGWSASVGMRAVIEDAAHLSTSPYYGTLRNSALAILDIITNKTDLDLSSSATGHGNLAMLGGWVTVGAITEAQKSQLVAMAAVAAPLTAVQVEAALAQLPATTWTGVVTSTSLQNGMVYATITYSSSIATVAPRVETTFGVDLTPQRVANIIAARVIALQTADAAKAMFG